MPSPHNYADTTGEERIEQDRAHVAMVTSTPSKPNTDPGQAVQVSGITFNGSMPASVLAPIEGDANVPREGSRVLVTFVSDQQPIVLGQLYYTRDNVDGSPVDADATTTGLPAYSPNDRRLGHPTTAANLFFDSAGAVTLASGDGNDIVFDVGDTKVEVGDPADADTVLVKTSNVDTFKLYGDGGIELEAPTEITLDSMTEVTESLSVDGGVSVGGGTNSVVTDVTVDNVNVSLTTSEDADGHIESVGVHDASVDLTVTTSNDVVVR